MCVLCALQTALDNAKATGKDAVVAFLTEFMSSAAAKEREAAKKKKAEEEAAAKKKKAEEVAEEELAACAVALEVQFAAASSYVQRVGGCKFASATVQLVGQGR